MKTIILAAFAALTLGLGIANADPLNQTMPQPNGAQYNITAGAAGWG